MESAIRIQIEPNRIINPNWQEATSWLFSSVAKDLKLGRPRSNPVSGQSRIRTREGRIASPTVLTTQPHCLLFATLQNKIVSHECFSVKQEAELCSFTYNSHLDNSN